MRKRKIPFKLVSQPYSLQDTDKFLRDSINRTMTVGDNKGVYYYNVPCAFDIETTSFYIDETGTVIDYETKMNRKEIDPLYNPIKGGTMYIWQFGINGRVIIGRTWDELVLFCSKLSDYLHLASGKTHLIVYIHNFSFEFQFMRKWFTWEKVFSTDERKPVYAITNTGIEFRCSYQLSGYSLANLSRDLMTYKVDKLVGDLDYSLLRNCETPLSDTELQYCINDVLVVMAYIKEKIEQEGGYITSLPLTKTGYVRAYCRKHTLYLPNHKRNKQYCKLIQDLRINDKEEFDTLQRAFAGGFTHANALYSRGVCVNVSSYDFTSSYPYVMVSEQFPMSTGVKVKVKDKEHFEKIIDKYLAVFDVRFNKIFTSIEFENYISVSKCFKKSNVTENNGRVVCADYIDITITNIDFEIIKKCYTWESMQVSNVYVYRKDYLPTPFVKCILKLYQDKTTLKGVKGSEIEYMLSKGMLNSCYGMTVTSPLRPEFLYTDSDTWVTQMDIDTEEKLRKHNESYNRFLFYPWGIFVTAYARRNLFTGILECGNDYIYADTDSIKLFNADKHKQYFDAYNLICERKLKKASEYHHLDYSLFAPKTNKGVTKMLGVWDYEGKYDYFKSLGAKRYMVSKKNAQGDFPISITVSGINKITAVPYMWEKSKGNIIGAFKMFEDGMEVPPEKTGKNLHTYTDEPISAYVVDYNGNGVNVYEKSSVNLEPTGYELGLASMYVDYLKKIKTEVI